MEDDYPVEVGTILVWKREHEKFRQKYGYQEKVIALAVEKHYILLSDHRADYNWISKERLEPPKGPW